MTDFMAAAVAVMVVVRVMNSRVAMIVAVSIVIAVMMFGIVAIMVSAMVFVFSESRTAKTDYQSQEQHKTQSVHTTPQIFDETKAANFSEIQIIRRNGNDDGYREYIGVRADEQLAIGN